MAMTPEEVLQTMVRRGYTPESLAHEVGCHPSTIRHIYNETNKANIQPKVLAKVEEVLKRRGRIKKWQ